MADKIDVQVAASADGKNIKIEMTHEGKKTGFSIPPNFAGTFAAGLLNAAALCASKSGVRITPFSQTKDPTPSIFALANGVALGNLDKPDVVAMVVVFGGTELNIGLPRAALQPLGSALWADSASGQKQ